MQIGGAGFVVIYQWRLKDGREPQFLKAWAALTVHLQAHRGAGASRLHRTDYGTLMAYAQWPDQATWERSCDAHEADQALSDALLDAVDETWPPILMTPLSDRPVTGAQAVGGHVTH
ncbi:MAG: antibiotic biosynthesis monooxygenase [Nevskiaceae bacterium]|nr:MAG: antibiotic biosynthesis monooxygenase [Nevskiaceae bacterium]